jgi:hypothetical protein
MIFYDGFKPSRHLLNQTTRHLLDKAFYSRRAKGLNVQFINRGNDCLDEWSFTDIESRDSFIARLESVGHEYAISGDL